ncbi:MAG: ABC transporter substrate-binding protein [Bacteroidia bacterium]|nr:ABC transporter substrate-binding protein [Bacteroidia bacterium]
MAKISSFFTICLLIALGGCVQKNNNDDKNRSKKTVFAYNEQASITSLDPAAASNFENIQAVNQLFNGLVQMDEHMNVVPCIAKWFKILPDRKTYLFYLRTDVKFHDDPCFPGGLGRRVVAEDFVYSFKRLANPAISSALSLMVHFERNEKGELTGIQALNDTTLQIRLSKPFGAFLKILTMKFFSVVPHEAVEYYKDNFRKHPVGTGPFKFKFWEENTKLVLHKNPSYFETDSNGVHYPYVDAISIHFIKEKQVAFMELLKGKIDMISGADALNINEILDKDGQLIEKYRNKFRFQKSQFMKTDYIGILLDTQYAYIKNNPIKNKLIRKAMFHAFDRKKLIQFLRNNIGVPANNGFIPHGLPSYDKSSEQTDLYQPELVKKLLKEAGFPEGKGLPTFTLHTTEQFREQVEFIQSQFEQNHIKLEISVEKASVLKEKVKNNEFILFKKSWIGDYADEENFLSMFYSKNFSPQGFNYFHYRNPKFDEIFENAMNETNDSIRISMYRELNAMIMEDVPVIPLYYDEVVHLVSKKISGLEPNPMNLLNLKSVRKSE